MTRSNDEIIAALRAGDAIDAAEAVVYAQNQTRPFLERIAELEAALRKINALIDSPGRFNPEVQAVLDSVIDTSDVKFANR